MADDKPKAPRKESPGAPKKADRLIEGKVIVQHFEKRNVMMNFWVQPSLKAAFMQACQQLGASPSDLLRDAMWSFVREHQDRQETEDK